MAFTASPRSSSPATARYRVPVKRRLRPQALGGAAHQGLVVPPEARAERNGDVEQSGLKEERLDDEEAGQRFADDGRLAVAADPLADRRHELVADEGPESGRSAHARRDLPVRLDVGRPGHVAAPLGVLDPHDDDRPHLPGANRGVDVVGDVRKVLFHSAVGHVQHRVADAGSRVVARRRVDVDAAGFSQNPGVKGPGLVRQDPLGSG